VNLALSFEGWCSLRLPTDPDPSDEPRGISGYTFAFAGEPDLDRILNLQPRAGMRYRSHGPKLGVTVRSAIRSDGRAIAALRGAKVDLLGEPIIENRNWTLTLPGFEPIVPFHLRIAGDGVALERVAPLNPADPSQPLWQVSQANLEAQGARGMEYEPATVGEAAGVWDPLGEVKQRLAALERDLAKEHDATARTALEGRIAELEFAVATPNDRRVLVRNFVERFGFPLTGDPVVEGAAKALGGLLTTAPWRIDFWLGAWDPDLLCLYMKGALNVAYAEPAA
jgi:hypothetical protein